MIVHSSLVTNTIRTVSRSRAALGMRHEVHVVAISYHDVRGFGCQLPKTWTLLCNRSILVLELAQHGDADVDHKSQYQILWLPVVDDRQCYLFLVLEYQVGRRRTTLHQYEGLDV
jgi:hypothetical protein